MAQGPQPLGPGRPRHDRHALNEIGAQRMASLARTAALVARPWWQAWNGPPGDPPTGPDPTSGESTPGGDR
jgi:hypothetical protein